MGNARPWTDAPLLAAALARWRNHWGGLGLFRVAAGPDWIRLHLEGDERPAILLTALPGAVMCFANTGPLPRPVIRALEAAPKHALPGLLKDARLIACGLMPGDRVACFHLATGGGDRFLLHQLFGPRGNTVLLDRDAKLLWSRHRPPHQLLSELPPAETWSLGEETAADKISEPAFAHLVATLVRRETESLRGRLQRRIRAAERLATNLQQDLDNAEKGDLYRRRAEALAAHLHHLSAGPEEVEVTDPRDGRPLTVPLDPALTPAANMEEWFRRARKAEKGREVVAGRLAEARTDLEAWEEALAELETCLANEGTDLEILERIQDWRASHSASTAPRRPPAPSGAT